MPTKKKNRKMKAAAEVKPAPTALELEVQMIRESMARMEKKLAEMEGRPCCQPTVICPHGSEPSNTPFPWPPSIPPMPNIRRFPDSFPPLVCNNKQNAEFEIIKIEMEAKPHSNQGKLL